MEGRWPDEPYWHSARTAMSIIMWYVGGMYTRIASLRIIERQAFSAPI